MAGMKCCHEGCTAPTQVTHTKVTKWGGIERKRKCYNEHTFTTLESLWEPDSNRRKATRDRNFEYVRTHPTLSTQDLMAALNLSKATVLRIRLEIKRSENGS